MGQSASMLSFQSDINGSLRLGTVLTFRLPELPAKMMPGSQWLLACHQVHVVEDVDMTLVHTILA